jgi:Dolichyl-phosphate-mannose-protein mannosyltransferase
VNSSAVSDPQTRAEPSGREARHPLTIAGRDVPWPIALLGLVILARLALAGWWLISDSGMADTESGRHMQRAWDGYVAMGNGHPFAFFASSTDYPPVHYLVASLGALVGGLGPDSFVGAQDVVFVPALAIGCYGAAGVAYGRLAGLLAAIFALGVPITASAFHMFLIDTPEAAMVAVSLWALLASDRFSRVGVSALAGLAVGLGMLSKQNFPVFVVGVIVVLLLRGGWRHWRGLLVFVAVAGLLTATWYWSEVGRTLDLLRGASGTAPATEVAGTATPSRWTSKNFGWYAWSTVNLSVLFPMALLAVGGTVALVVRWIRHRTRDDLTPELVAGGLVAYLGLSWLVLKDPRYALPALPYLAILGTGWMPLLGPIPGRIAVACLCAVALLNVVGTVAERGDPVRITFPGAPHSGLGERQLTLYEPGGWVTGPPETSGAVPDVLHAARAAGVRQIAFDPGATQNDFNQPGLDILSRTAGLQVVSAYDDRYSNRAVIADHFPPLARPAPCAVTDSGAGIYLSRGALEGPFEARRFFCPRSGR